MRGTGRRTGGGRRPLDWMTAVAVTGVLLMGTAACDRGTDRQAEGDLGDERRGVDGVDGAPGEQGEARGSSDRAGEPSPTTGPGVPVAGEDVGDAVPDTGGATDPDQVAPPDDDGGVPGEPGGGEIRGRDPGDGGGTGSGDTGEILDTTS